MKKNVLIFLFMTCLVFLFLSCMSFPFTEGNDVLCDRFSGYEISKLERKFGKKYSEEKYFVDDKYVFYSEVEPDYFKYFTEDEKKTGIIVCEKKWKKLGITIIVWSKESEDKKWIVFSSVEFKNNVKF